MTAGTTAPLTPHMNALRVAGRKALVTYITAGVSGAVVPAVVVVPEGYDGITYQLTVEINHRRKELSDARVRQALSLAIDRKFVVDTIFLGYAKTASGPVPAFDKQFFLDDARPPPSIRRAPMLCWTKRDTSAARTARGFR